METKTYLVLGANGFMGRHIVDELAKDPTLEVKAFDRYSSAVRFKTNSNVSVIKGDIFDDSDVTSAISGADVVVHCFSATTPFTSDINPYLDMTDNVINNIKIFERCAELKVRKVAFISSGGAVYGTACEKGEVNEDSVPNPVSPYGIGKLTTEHYLEYFKRKTKLDYTVFRLTNPYGPGQLLKHNQGVIPAFIDRIEKREKITIYGDGSMTRDFIYIGDAVGMIVRSLAVDCKHNVYNIGSGQQTSLRLIVETLEKLIGVGVEIDYKEAPKTFLQKTPVSIDRYVQEFGHGEQTSLEDGLKRVLNSH